MRAKIIIFLLLLNIGTAWAQYSPELQEKIKAIDAIFFKTIDAEVPGFSTNMELFKFAETLLKIKVQEAGYTQEQLLDLNIYPGIAKSMIPAIKAKSAELSNNTQLYKPLEPEIQGQTESQNLHHLKQNKGPLIAAPTASELALLKFFGNGLLWLGKEYVEFNLRRNSYSPQPQYTIPAPTQCSSRLSPGRTYINTMCY